MINIVISGYIGYSNCGDDAILLALCDGIRKLNIEARITALSKNPTVTMKENNIKSIYRFNWKAVMGAIREADIIISGGGSLLQDRTSTRSLLYYLGIIKLAKLFKKKVMLYANGIGPINKKLNRIITKYIVNDVDLITLRDELSMKELQSIHVTKPRMHVTADPVFSMKPLDRDAKQILEDAGVPMDKPLIGVLFREWNKLSYADTIARVCDRLIEKKDVTIVLIPMEYHEDIGISKKIEQHMTHKGYVIDQDLDSSAIISLIGEMHMILSMRLHALLFAALSSVPMVGVVYDPKVSCYLELLGMPSAGDIHQLDEEEVRGLIYQVYDHYDTYVEKLNKIKIDMRKKAELNTKYLMDLINE